MKDSKLLIASSRDYEKPFILVTKKPVMVQAKQMEDAFVVQTAEGKMKGLPGDWLITGVEGELYPCDKTVFKKTYNAGEE